MNRLTYSEIEMLIIIAILGGFVCYIVKTH